VFGLYNGALRKAINLLKYYSIKRLEHPLSDVLLHVKLPEVDGVVPVPLYRKRLRQRGFNQSALLAKHAAGNLGVPLVTDCLMKTRDTVQQVGLDAVERKKNIRNAFAVQNREPVYGKKILLVDDVITTGATVRECSKVLKKAGAHDVYVLALAQGVRELV
jgi:ComF family protein